MCGLIYAKNILIMSLTLIIQTIFLFIYLFVYLEKSLDLFDHSQNDGKFTISSKQSFCIHFIDCCGKAGCFKEDYIFVDLVRPLVLTHKKETPPEQHRLSHTLRIEICVSQF